MSQGIDFAEVLEPAYMRLLARSIIGTDDPTAIQNLVTELAEKMLGVDVLTCFLFELSVGAAFGVEDREGRRYILKILSPENSIQDAEKRTRFQKFLSDRGFPCPKVAVDPIQLDNRVVIAEEYFNPGMPMNGHLVEHRKLMASGLAKIVDLSGNFQGREAFPRQALLHESGALWPKPHNALFDFARVTENSAWIDEIAKDCLGSWKDESGQLVIGHLDWSAKHCRIADGKLSAVHDWDSTALAPETRVVAGALCSFTYSEEKGAPTAPALNEMVSFLGEYESARNFRFHEYEIEKLAARVLYNAAYTAKCEDSIDSGLGSRTAARNFLRLLNEANFLETLISR